jgi:DnaJ-class molecular chaperone
MVDADLYHSLGVDRDDGALAVRRAYRDLARLSSPSTDAVPTFIQEIELACAVLSDGARRARYDRRPHPSAATAPPALDLLGDFEGGPPSREEVRNSFRSNFAPGAEPKSARIEVLDLSIRLAGRGAGPIEDLSLGVPLFHACPACHGTGSVSCCACGACEATGLVEERLTVRLPAGLGEWIISLEALGVRSPILRLRVTSTT